MGKIREEIGRGENLSFLTAHTTLSRQDNQLTRNIVRTLLKSTALLVLLGDPGSGKRVTLRQIGLRLARWRQPCQAPLIPLYLPLNTFSNPLANPSAVRQFIADTVRE